MRSKNRCYICGKPAVKLCDYPGCNKPMCLEHACHIGSDNDVCKEHFNKIDIEKSKENRKKLKEIENYFYQQYENSSFRVVPGHWPEFKSKEEVDRWIELNEQIWK